jgi:uncharacterized protein YhdP
MERQIGRLVKARRGAFCRTPGTAETGKNVNLPNRRCASALIGATGDMSHQDGVKIAAWPYWPSNLFGDALCDYLDPCIKT